MNNEINIRELTTQEIYQWIADDANQTETDANGKSVTHTDEASQVLIKALVAIEEFVAQVLEGDDPAFVLTERLVERNDLKRIKKDIERLPLAKYFTSVIELFQQYSPSYEYSLNVTLFFNCCFSLDLGKEWFTQPLANTTKAGKLAFERYNDLIKLIRTEGRNAEFRGEKDYKKYNALRNYDSAVKFIKPLFKRRQLVLRVDFSYQTKFASMITTEIVRKDLAHFLSNLRHNKKLSEHLEAYMWKIEYGYQKGFHIHCLFFYDGSKIQNDEWWGNKLGAYWKDVVTKGRGMFYNGNTKENKAKFEKLGLLGIGMIGRVHEEPDQDTDKEKRDILLNRIVAYILKADQFLLAKKLSAGNARIFGKGRLKVNSKN
jgi:hypothetical protein